MRLQWTRDEVDAHLKKIMADIHAKAAEYGRHGDHIDYIAGANIAGFKKVADSMIAQGLV
jgi:glutamate dehydrogenase/leucine dehydrogenase